MSLSAMSRSCTFLVREGRTKMKLSVFFHHLESWEREKKVSIDEVLESTKALGIDYVELDMADVARIGKENLKKLLDRHKMKVSSIYCFYNWNADPEDFKEYEHIEQAKVLGSKKIMIIPGFYSDLKDEEKKKAELTNMLKGMKKLCERAKSEGIIPTIEDFDSEDSPIRNVEGMKKFLDEVEELRVAFDTGNFLYSGEEVKLAFEEMKEKIVHVHLKDRKLKTAKEDLQLTNEQKEMLGERKPAMTGDVMYSAYVGEGMIPIKEIVNKLEERGFEGIFVIEHFGVTDYQKAVEASARYLLDK